MINRKDFLQLTSLGLSSFWINGLSANQGKITRPLVLSTWNEGIAANAAAWQILRANGRALDAVEAGVNVTEASLNCCVGLGANPDRDGFVTLDACIMDEHGNCGSVAALEQIKHPVSVARRIMEKTPHVMLVGDGARAFALAEGFALEPNTLSPDAQKEYKKWLEKSEYKPEINIENRKRQQAFAPATLSSGQWNHDTIGMIALDAMGNLSGSCTTSGMGFKMRGRVGDSPIIGAGLYVDNEIGAAVATGLGEEVIKICGTHLVVELMRQGASPKNACKAAVERLIKRDPVKAKNNQVGFIALNKKGMYGAYCLQKGFNYAVGSGDGKNVLMKADSYYK